MAKKIVRLPITNTIADGDYTAEIRVGSQGKIANVILDTGSSTLAVKPGKYKPSTDTDLKPTALAQDVIYGTGGWAGPVVQTSLKMGAVSLSSYVALADEQEPRNFGKADGILGLAYNVLNNAFDLSAFLKEQGRKPLTYPWPFPIKNSSAAINQ